MTSDHDEIEAKELERKLNNFYILVAGVIAFILFALTHSFDKKETVSNKETLEWINAKEHLVNEWKSEGHLPSITRSVKVIANGFKDGIGSATPSNDKCVVRLNRSLISSGWGNWMNSLSQDFVLAHEVSHCSHVTKNGYKTHDDKYREESFADAMGILILAQKHDSETVAELARNILVKRSIDTAFHGFNEHSTEASLICVIRETKGFSSMPAAGTETEKLAEQCTQESVAWAENKKGVPVVLTKVAKNYAFAASNTKSPKEIAAMRFNGSKDMKDIFDFVSKM